MDIKPLKIEIEKRRNANTALVEAEAAFLLAIADYTKLDAGFQDELDSSRVALESIYIEQRHYSGDWPIVYSNSQINKYFEDAINAVHDRISPTKALEPVVSGVKQVLSQYGAKKRVAIRPHGHALPGKRYRLNPLGKTSLIQGL